MDTVNTDIGGKNHLPPTWVRMVGAFGLTDNREINKRTDKVWEHSKMSNSLNSQR